MSDYTSASPSSASASNGGNANGSQPGYRLLWISLLVFGLVGLSLNAFARKGGMANGYVEVNEMKRVAVTDTVKGAETIWVAPDDPKLASGEYKRVEGVAARTWEVRSLVSAKEAEGMIAARDAGDTTVPLVVASTSSTMGIWVAAFLTLGIFSFLYRDNPWYKVTESVLIGVSAAYWMINAFWSTLVPNLFGALAPNFVRTYVSPDLPISNSPTLDFSLALVPLVLGFLLLWRLAPRNMGGWISVWPIAFIIGTTAGMKLVSGIEADLLAQAVATMKPLVVLEQASGSNATASTLGAFSFWGTLGSLAGVIGVLSVLVYFFFSLEHKGAVGKTARLGVWFLMVTFGSAFGLTVMGRITLLAQRFEFLFNDWLRVS